MTILRRAAAVAALCTAVATISPPAHAQRATFTDPAGDASQPGLDITTVDVRNRDHSFVAVVGFDRVVRGDVIVSVAARGGPGVRIVSEHRPRGEDRTFVLEGHFGSEGGSGPACGAGTAVWDEQTSTATLRFPSRCLADGDYGAVRVAVLTERGGDTDFARQRRSDSPWIARG